MRTRIMRAERRRSKRARNIIPVFLPLLILVFAVIGVHAGAAGVPTVSCGEVIYTDVRLESDLVNCPGYGLVVGADDVTVNLNGHMISSSGETIGALGVFAALHTGVTVKNGSIRGFSGGVFIGERSRVSGMLIREAELGSSSSSAQEA